MTKQEFINKYKDAIIDACEGSGIFPSVKMAQLILESGFGKRPITNNVFGIKAKGVLTPYWDGASTMRTTTEEINGERKKVQAPFRAYKSVSDSIKDHTYFLQSNPRYAKSGVFTAETPEDQARALQAAGYATDSKYSHTLISIIRSNNLKKLDKKKV